MKKKKILFVIPGFTLGGTIISLISLLGKIDYNKYEVDLYSRSFLGYDKVCDKLLNCNILEENVLLSSTVRTKGVLIKLFSLLLQLAIRCSRKFGYDLYSLCAKIGCKQINTCEYDAVIAYQESMVDELSNWSARRKIIWIHSDYIRNAKINPRVLSQNIKFNSFDDIVCVSKSAQDSFCSVFPELRNKTSVVYNIIDKDYISKKANEDIKLNSSFDQSKYAIISCGRIDPVKQFHLIPSIADVVKKNCNIPFKWYIIGGDRNFETYKDLIIQEIDKYNLSDIVLFLGEQSNVYPYISKSNLLVSLSESETFALVIHEALALGIPVIMNDIPVAYELLKNNEAECICNLSEVADKIVKTICVKPVVESYRNLNDIAINSFNRLFL